MSTLTDYDALDTRIVFKVYAMFAWVAGAFLYAWGGLVIRGPLVEGLPYSDGMVVRIVGAVLFGVGFLAIAMARSHDDEARRGALGWWAIGHAVVLAGMGLQFSAIVGWDHLEWGGLLALAFLVAASVLFGHLWQTVDGIPWGGLQTHDSVLDELRRPTVRRLRSTYEEQIRRAASQEERHRLARDLHDSIKQQIFVMHTAAATAQARLASDPDGASAAIEQVRNSAREAMTEMEAMLDQLRATPLENNGLIEALKKQCEALRFRTGADVQVVVGELPPSESLPPGAQQVIFRVAQEALANVGRHARATHVTVTLDSTPVSVQLRVDDNGLGFDPETITGGMGLGSMRARVSALGGILAVTSEPGKGALVRASIPHARAHTVGVTAYRRRVLFWGAITFVWLGNLALAVTMEGAGERRGTIVMWSVFLFIHCVVFARVVAAYRRARRAASTPASEVAAS